MLDLHGKPHAIHLHSPLRGAIGARAAAPRPGPATGGEGRGFGIVQGADPSSITELVDGAMQRFADADAFDSFGITLTYRDVDERSRAFAAFLQSRGVGPGDRVAVMVPNIVAFPIALLGIVRAGAAQVNVNPLYTPRELEHQLDDAGTETIVVFDGATPALAEVAGRTPIRTVICCGPGDGTARVLAGPATDARLRHAVRFADALEQGARLAFDRVRPRGDDLLFLQYTGGTTGPSKGAALSHRNLLANIGQLEAVMSDALRPRQETIVTAIPLYHIFALMMNLLAYFAVGAKNYLVADPRDTDALVDVLKRSRPTAFTGVNTLYATLARHARIGEVDFSRLRVAIGGGAAVLPATSARWREITGQDILQGYGLSETSPVLALEPMGSGFSGTVGKPVPGTEIVLLDADDVPVPTGTRGEICVRGPQVMAGYWKQPEANRSAFTAGGFFRTGDIGVFDDRGLLRIVDRKKDMIIVSGFNVFPNEIEAVAGSLPGVAECACVGTPDAKSGEAVTLYVVKAPGSALTEDDVLAFCRRELTGYKVPKLVRFIDAMPKSSVGKILRRELRDRAAGLRTAP